MKYRIAFFFRAIILRFDRIGPTSSLFPTENRLARQRQFLEDRLDVEATISRKAWMKLTPGKDSLLGVTDINDSGGIPGDDNNSRSTSNRVRSS